MYMTVSFTERICSIGLQAEEVLPGRLTIHLWQHHGMLEHVVICEDSWIRLTGIVEPDMCLSVQCSCRS